MGDVLAKRNYLPHVLTFCPISRHPCLTLVSTFNTQILSLPASLMSLPSSNLHFCYRRIQQAGQIGFSPFCIHMGSTSVWRWAVGWRGVDGSWRWGWGSGGGWELQWGGLGTICAGLGITHHPPVNASETEVAGLSLIM